MRECLETVVNDYLTQFLLRYFRNATAANVERPQLSYSHDIEFLRLHWAISQPVQKLVTCLRENPQQLQSVLESRLREGGTEIATELGLEIGFEKVGGFDPVSFDENCVAAVRSAAERLGYTHRNLISGAGHDACWINRVAPTAMVMCPCVDGLSHNEAEEISPEWAEAGANVLMHAVLDTAEVVS